jgi:hypothetical protein
MSPFTFHRGAALVMAADLAGTIASGLRVVQGYEVPVPSCEAEPWRSNLPRRCLPVAHVLSAREAVAPDPVGELVQAG